MTQVANSSKQKLESLILRKKKEAIEDIKALQGKLSSELEMLENDLGDPNASVNVYGIVQSQANSIDGKYADLSGLIRAYKLIQ
jgi:hypothetical protein